MYKVKSLRIDQFGYKNKSWHRTVGRVVTRHCHDIKKYMRSLEKKFEANPLRTRSKRLVCTKQWGCTTGQSGTVISQRRFIKPLCHHFWGSAMRCKPLCTIPLYLKHVLKRTQDFPWESWSQYSRGLGSISSVATVRFGTGSNRNQTTNVTEPDQTNINWFQEFGSAFRPVPNGSERFWTIGNFQIGMDEW